MNQSKLEEVTCSWRKARENAHEVVSFTFDWMKLKVARVFKPIVQRRKCKTTYFSTLNCMHENRSNAFKNRHASVDEVNKSTYLATRTKYDTYTNMSCFYGNVLSCKDYLTHQDKESTSLIQNLTCKLTDESTDLQKPSSEAKNICGTQQAFF